MSIVFHKEINSDYYLAFEEDELFNRKSSGVAIIKRISDGVEEQITPPIFSPSFIETVLFPEGCSGYFYHLHVNRETVGNWMSHDKDYPDFLLAKYDYLDPSHNDLFGSYLFLKDFSEHVRFELLFDHIAFEDVLVDNSYYDPFYLIGTVGGMTFKGHVELVHKFQAVIPIKYKQIIFGRRYYVAAYDGQGWDIYDNFNMDGNRVHYMKEDRYGDMELDPPSIHSYNEYYSCCKNYGKFDPQSERRLLYRRLIRTKVSSVTDSLDEPYPITDTGLIDLIGIPREVDGDSVFSEVLKSPYPIRDRMSIERIGMPNEHDGYGPDYYYIVTQDNKKGLWHNEIIDKQYQNSNNTSKHTLYGIGKKVLNCHYLDIIPIQEDILLYYTQQGHPVSYRACNSFSIQSESGWGVYDGLKGRTLLPTVFDQPVRIILGPEGYICRINGKYGIVDKNGNQFLPFIYDEIEVITEDVKSIITSEDGDYYWLIETKVKCIINGDISEYTFVYDDTSY